ncbi:MAG: hypothetical protein GC200_04455 [Tepidisphaera sp.]|nr:hypothetical protein [Tepidisphaera sp.]
MGKPSTTKPGDAGFRWGAFARYLSSFTVLVLGLALLVGAIIGMRPLEARAAALHGRGPVRIEIHWPLMADQPSGGQTWLPKAQQEQLESIALGAAGASPDPYSASPLARVSSALFDTGWFSALPTVTRDRRGGIVVDGTFRVPAAVVRKDGKDSMIAWDGKLMPAVYEPGESRLPAIIEPSLGPPATKGGERDYQTPWAGEDLAASIELLDLVMRQPWRDQVLGIDASAYSRDSTLAIITRANTRIVWGGRPSKPRVGEVTTRQKLAYLAQLQHDAKRIDGGYPLIYVNSSRLQFDTSASAQQALKAEAAPPASGTP